MSSDEITYIVPVFNAGEGIERCVESVLEQTSDAYQALFIDDGSSDDSLTRLQAYAAEHPGKFKVLTQENSGVANTRLRGIREAETKYVAFIDQDDFLDQDFTETLLTAIVEQDADIVISGHRRVDDKRVIYETRYGNDELSKYLAETCWAKAYRRNFLIENDIQFLDANIGEDIFFSCSSYLKTNRVIALDYVGYNWYMNPASVSNTVQRGLREDCDVLVLAEALDELFADSPAKTEVFDYYLYSEVLVQFLRSGIEASPERFLQEYERHRDWLDAHGYKLEIPFYDKRLRSAKMHRRIGISLFDRLGKLHLTGLVAKLCCRG